MWCSGGDDILQSILSSQSKQLHKISNEEHHYYQEHFDVNRSQGESDLHQNVPGNINEIILVISVDSIKIHGKMLSRIFLQWQ